MTCVVDLVAQSRRSPARQHAVLQGTTEPGNRRGDKTGHDDDLGWVEGVRSAQEGLLLLVGEATALLQEVHAAELRRGVPHERHFGKVWLRGLPHAT